MRTQPARRAGDPHQASDATAGADGSFARSALRLVALFEALAKAAEGLSLAELSGRLGAPKSSLLAILRSMVAAGYMEHGHGLYRLGPKSFRLAAGILAVRRFPALVRPIMQDLATKSGETVFLVLLDGAAQRMTYADIIDSPNPVRYTVPPGTTRPLYVSAGGQMLLAYQEPAWIEAYVKDARLDPLTPRTITDRDALRRRLAAIRRDGFAVSLGETVPGAAGVAAPIVNADGSVTAGLLIGAPIDRFEPRLAELKRLLHAATARAAGIAQALAGEEAAVRG